MQQIKKMFFIVSILCLAPHSGFAKEASQDTYKSLELFGEVFERVQHHYVEPLTDEQLIEHAIKGLLSNLDPHSSYLDPKSFAEMKVQTQGSFGGLGIEVTMENGFVKVIAPIDDTPAFRAGVESGDIITHIDNKSILGLTLNEAVERMRGPAGTNIKVTIRRGAKELVFDIVRDTIKIVSVKSRLESRNIGVIRISTFNEQTEAGLKKAIDTLNTESKQNLAGIVLDLRSNPGGLLDQAIAVSNAFLEKGEIVSTRGRDAKDIQRFYAEREVLVQDIPIVVLINSGSASASEIVAGALRDHKRAIIMGTRSFGKGSVQTIIPLGNEGAMRLTMARYYTPSGQSIQGVGITPDIVVEQAKIEPIVDKGYHEADLNGALIGQDKPQKTEGDVLPEAKTTDKNAKDDKTVQDYQLDRALDLVNGLVLAKQMR